MKCLVIVDVQKEFNDFIQYDLVDELFNYAKKFKKVYQIWDTHKNDISPTYTFPNEIYSVKKKYGKNHFSKNVKDFIKKVEYETPEGNLFKLNNGGYIVRVDNNHDWFYINSELVNLINDIKNDEIILVGGANNECLEDVYQAFKSFGLNVKLNKKYIYSAKTNKGQSIKNQIITEKFEYDDILIIEIEGDTNDFIKFEDMLISCNLKYSEGNEKIIEHNKQILFNYLSIIFKIKPYNNTIVDVYFGINRDGNIFRTIYEFDTDERYKVKLNDLNRTLLLKMLGKSPTYQQKKIIKEFKEFKR